MRVTMYSLSFFLFFFILRSSAHTPVFTTNPCVATANIDDINDVFDFKLDGWVNQNSTFVDRKGDHFLPGVWSYTVEFCVGIVAYLGDGPMGDSLGYSFGRLQNFTYLNNHTHPLTPVDPTHDVASKQFVQVYSDGDSGAPCGDKPRTSTVNIWCGPSLDCASVDGAKSKECPSPASERFCVCSVQKNPSGDFCDGLIINIVSNHCPTGTFPPSDEHSHTAGIVFAVLFVLVFVAFIGTYVYNWRQGKRGTEAIPCSGLCCRSSSNAPIYNAPPTSVPGYSSSVSGSYQSS